MRAFRGMTRPILFALSTLVFLSLAGFLSRPHHTLSMFCALVAGVALGSLLTTAIDQRTNRPARKP
jgi:hypothetical protein